MATAYDRLREMVQTLTNNPASQVSANTLLEKGFYLSIDEVLNIHHCNSQAIYCFRNLILFLRYLGEAPKGPAYNDQLKQQYIDTLQSIPNECKTEVAQFISSIYLGALSKELEVQNIDDLRVWIETYNFLKSSNVEIQPFENSLSMKLSSILWEVIGETEKDIKKCIERASLAAFAQRNGFNLGDIVSLFISSIHGYLNIKYEMYNGNGKNNLTEISNLVYVMKELKFDSDMEKFQIKQLEDFFGARPLTSKPIKPEPEFQRDPSLPYSPIDFNTLSYISTVYANAGNPNFNISIYHYACSIKGDTALKVYDIKNPGYDLNKIKNEVDILETLSAKKTQSSCFINFYGSHWEQNKIYISMEYFKDTLMTKLTEMKQNKQQFTEDHMKYYAGELISAHALMEQLGIFHQDIKPQNILMTSDWKLKIIDFSVSVSKSYDEVTLAATGMHYIQGTQGYMAPELQIHALDTNKVQVRYSRRKADVFSLGLVLLQMYTLEEIHTLNLPDNNSKLMQKIQNLPFVWFQTLLVNMLDPDFRKRASFKKALNFIPGRATMTMSK